MAELGGPYVTMAILCEKVIESKDGPLSVIRIIDRMTVSPGPDSPEIMPPASGSLVAVLAFKSGMYNGKMLITLTMSTPSKPNEESHIASYQALFEGNERGVNLVFNLNLVFREEGLYWFTVKLEEHAVTRVPLRVMYQRVQIGSLPPNP